MLEMIGLVLNAVGLMLNAVGSGAHDANVEVLEVIKFDDIVSERSLLYNVYASQSYARQP